MPGIGPGSEHDGMTPLLPIIAMGHASAPELTTYLKVHPDMIMEVRGHTDNVGDATSNLTLSKARAQAVVDQLLVLGLDPKRIRAAGLGETHPDDSNATPEGQARNRRVEIHFVARR